MPKFTFIDLFGAPGGMSLGFKMAGMKPLAALDVNEKGLDTYRRNFPSLKKNRIILADASHNNVVEKFKETTKLKKGDVGVIIGGPPCQGFSIIGRIKIASLANGGNSKKRKLHPRFIEDKRNHLYKAFVKFIKYFEPKAVVMENVLGMNTYKDGLIVEQIKKDFRQAGCANVESRVLNAVNYGVPQSRRRIFFIGTKKNVPITFPEQTHFKKSEFDRSFLDPKAREYVTVWNAIGDLPSPPTPVRGIKVKDAPVLFRKKPSCEYQTWVRNGSKELHNHITRWHRKKDHQVFSHMKPGGRWLDLSYRDRKLIGYSDESFEDKWKRLPRNEPSWTVVSHIHKDGYMYIHPTQNRTISVREAARLQSFPDNFIFEGYRTPQFLQVGNAVPPLLAKAVGEKVKKILTRKNG